MCTTALTVSNSAFYTYEFFVILSVNSDYFRKKH
jgi:hypothetical protein